jgi:transcriptional regulator with XRE-family HTH domain
MTRSLGSNFADPPLSSVGQMLRHRRRELGLSPEDLAERMEGSTSAADIRVLESGRVVMPSWIRLLHLAKALETPVEALLGQVDAESRQTLVPTQATMLPSNQRGATNHTSLQETNDESLSQ